MHAKIFPCELFREKLTERVLKLLLETKVIPPRQREVPLHVRAPHLPAAHESAGKLEHVGVRRVIAVRGDKISAGFPSCGDGNHGATRGDKIGGEGAAKAYPTTEDHCNLSTGG